MAIDGGILFRILVMVALGILILIHLQLLWNQSKGINPVVRELAAVKSLAARVDPPSVEYDGKEWRCAISPRASWIKRVALEISKTAAIDNIQSPPGWDTNQNGSRIIWQAATEESETAGTTKISFLSQGRSQKPSVLTVTYVVEGPVPEERSQQFVVMGPA